MIDHFCCFVFLTCPLPLVCILECSWAWQTRQPNGFQRRSADGVSKAPGEDIHTINSNILRSKRPRQPPRGRIFRTHTYQTGILRCSESCKRTVFLQNHALHTIECNVLRANVNYKHTLKFARCPSRAQDTYHSAILGHDSNIHRSEASQQALLVL